MDVSVEKNGTLGVSRTKSRSTSATRSRSALPSGIGEGERRKIWTGVFVATLLKFVGSRGEPWDASSERLLPAMRLIFSRVFPDVEHEIKENSAVFQQVCNPVNLNIVY